MQPRGTGGYQQQCLQRDRQTLHAPAEQLREVQPLKLDFAFSFAKLPPFVEHKLLVSDLVVTSTCLKFSSLGLNSQVR